MSTPTLHGRVAVVVGGTSGIGLAPAEGLVEAGADVVPFSRRADMVERAAVTVRAPSTRPGTWLRPTRASASP